MGNQHKRQLLDCPNIETLDINAGAPDLRGLCVCTAKDGHLCLACKTRQNEMVDQELAICYGNGCSATKDGSFEGRICLWCDLPLPGGRSRAEARREYDTKHLRAKMHW